MSTMESSQIRLSADVGGTFTDVAAFDETTGELQLGKTLTTPARLVDGIESGVAKAGAALSRGAALPPRHDRRDQHHPGAHRRALRAAHHPGLSRHLRDRPRQPAGILQSVLPPARAADRPRSALRDPRARRFAGQGADQARRGPGARRGRRRGRRRACRRSRSCFCTPTAIRRTSSGSRRSSRQSHPQLFVTASHELSQEYREFERTSTAAANAYVGPRVRRYLGEMGEHLEAAGFGGEFLIVQSNGGLFDVDEAQQRLHPDAGVRARPRASSAPRRCATASGSRTRSPSTWAAPPPRPASSIKGDVLMIGSTLIGGYATGLPVQIPMIDIQEVGTGGGSHRRASRWAARCMSGRKAPAPQPGPVCYGQGGVEPTITDANLILGRLGADRFLGGEMRLDLDGATRARWRQRVADAARARSDRGGRRHSAHRHHQDVPHGALGDHRARARRRRFLARRLWRRRTAACRRMVARELRIAKVVIPRAPGHFSAYGMLVADLRRDFVDTWFTPLADGLVRGDRGDLRRDGAARPRRRRAAARLAIAGVAVSASADMRYVGQEHAGHGRAADRAVPRRRTATASSGASMRCTRPATAIRRRPRRPRS